MSLSAPALGRTDHNTTVIAVHNTNDNSLRFYWNNDGDTTWNSSVIAGAGTTFAAPALARTGNDSTVIAARGPNNSLNFYWNNDGDATWHASVIAGQDTTYSDPAICRTDNGVTIVAVQGPNHALSAFWNNDGDPAWHPFTGIASVRSSLSIAAIRYPATGDHEHPGPPSHDVVSMFFVGENNALHYAYGPADSGYQGYSVVDTGAPLGNVSGPPAIEYNTSNNWLLVAGRGTDNSLIYYWYDGTMWHPSSIAGPSTTYSDPSMGRTDHNSTIIAAQGPNNSLNFYWNNDGDSSWNPSVVAGSGTTYSAPAVGHVAREATIIAVHGPNNQLLFYWNNDGDGTWHQSLIGTL